MNSPGLKFRQNKKLFFSPAVVGPILGMGRGCILHIQVALVAQPKKIDLLINLSLSCHEAEITVSDK